MEKIKVNMTPNPLDVQTIHASQNDGEARQWEFELHNNGELIDTSEVTEQMVFKSYKGGTEQILPENTSTPTTSPFIGDIRYPQGLLTDQEFTYRQSPTEEDGLAKITDIKGNTLVWNQLANVGTLSATASYNGYLNIGTFSFVAKHKYLIKYHQDNTMASNTRNTLQVRFAIVGQTVTENATANAHLSQGDYSWLFNSAYTDTNTIVRFWVADNNVAVSYSNIMVIDLTQMGLDITEPSEFTSLFPLSYYSYNQGSLLSFNGNGIKTVGKNLLKLVDKSGTYNGITYSCEDNVITLKGTANGASVIDFSIDGGFLRLYPRFQYTKGLSPIGTYNGVQTSLRGQNASPDIVGFWSSDATSITESNINADAYYFRVQINDGFTIDCALSAQLEIGNVATDFEPYTSSTLSLPISTYFPNGMDGINDARDEKSETGYVKRIGQITFDGTQTPVINTVTSTQCRAFYNVSDVLPVTRDSQVIEQDLISNYLPCNSNYHTNLGAEGIHRRIGGQRQICVSLGTSSGVTTVDAFNAYLSSHPLTVLYPLATPLENYGVVDLGTLDWTAVPTGNTSYRMSTSGIANAVKKVSASSVIGNIVCSKYQTNNADATYLRQTSIAVDRVGNIIVYDPNYNTSTSAEAFKQAMSGVYLLYEKENPQGFTTASLVTENAEIPLSNEDGVLIGKCTEELSSQPGFIDAKIRLSDGDGDCYSNKIQLHVERKP